MNLKSIIFVLENCDSIEIPGRYIGDMNAYNLKTNIERVACNAFAERTVCEVFYVEIHRDAERIRYPFDDSGIPKPHSLFERLSYGDITSVRLVMDGEERDIMVPWDPQDTCCNRWQVSRISKCGHFYITISEESVFDEIFPAIEIDNPDIVDMHMALRNVGDKFRED
ncbi:MAG: hypothetical protein J6S14_15825 [Clostridia bacterium]|nr:hypothetical protein [Clostridia bacterium]